MVTSTAAPDLAAAYTREDWQRGYQSQPQELDI